MTKASVETVSCDKRFSLEYYHGFELLATGRTWEHTSNGFHHLLV